MNKNPIERRTDLDEVMIMINEIKYSNPLLSFF